MVAALWWSGWLASGARLAPLAAALFCLCAGLARAEGADCRHITVSGHPDYPPFQWREGGRIVGASADLAERVAADLGMVLRSVYLGPWQRVLKSARHGRVDLILPLQDTPERRAYLVFGAQPAFRNPKAVFVRLDRAFDYAGWGDLRGRSGAANAGDRFGGGFDEFAAANLLIEEGRDARVNLSKLAAGRVDYYLTGLETGRALIAAQGLGATVGPLAPTLNDAYIHYAFAAASPCRRWAEAFDRRVAAYVADGTSARLLEANLRRWRDGKRKEAAW